MIKQNLGYTVRARVHANQNAEMFLLAITHNILIILFLFFQRAFLQSRISDLEFSSSPPHIIHPAQNLRQLTRLGRIKLQKLFVFLALRNRRQMIYRHQRPHYPVMVIVIVNISFLVGQKIV